MEMVKVKKLSVGYKITLNKKLISTKVTAEDLRFDKFVNSAQKFKKFKCKDN